MNFGRSARLILFAPLAILASALAQSPVPVREEPRHKVAFENDYVRVIDVRFPPGDTSLYHIHTIPSVVVELATATICSQEFGKPPPEPRQVLPGETRYAPYDETPLTHRVTNRGTTLFRVLDIELLRPKPAAPWNPAALPPDVKLEWEQKLVRTYRARIAAGRPCALPADDSARLLIGIAGTADTTGRRDGQESHRTLAAGEYLFFPAHSGIQIDSAAADCVLLELR